MTRGHETICKCLKDICIPFRHERNYFLCCQEKNPRNSGSKLKKGNLNKFQGTVDGSEAICIIFKARAKSQGANNAVLNLLSVVTSKS